MIEKGTYAALPTPFFENGDVNYHAIDALVAHNAQQGMTGVYALGSTAEVFTLSYNERHALMKEIATACKRYKLQSIAHVGSLNLREAVALGLHAQELGYHAISAVTPFYYKYSFEEITHYYKTLTNAVALPFVIYVIPSLSGVSLSLEQIQNLHALPHVQAIKFTSSDMFQLEQIKRTMPQSIVFNGFDELYIAGLAMGADGAIGSTLNIQGERFIKLRECVNNGAIETARGIQNSINSLIEACTKHGFLQSLKAMLNLAGLNAGVCRTPTARLSSQALEEVEKVYTEHFCT